METRLWTIKHEPSDQDMIREAAQIIKKSGLVAFPTETVYGLGANGLDQHAVQKIFRAKGRPQDNPLILHIAQVEEVFNLASPVSLQARAAMEAFWPGPLTLVLPAKPHIPRAVTAGLATVALRMPQHPVALALIKEAGVPIAAPSANRSGYPSPTRAEHVLNDLDGLIEGVIDGGATGIGLESTVLDLSGPQPCILRPGGITPDDLRTVLGQVTLDPGLLEGASVPKAPGMKYAHYAPRARVFLLEGDRSDSAERITAWVQDHHQKGHKVGLLLTAETAEHLGPISVGYQRVLGSRQHLPEIAHNIYHELRHCDLAGVDVILTETYTSGGLGLALMNRLAKSAGQLRCQGEEP